MRALVTGATGFIGRHLCAALVAAGDDVVALVRPSSKRAALERLGVRFAVGDVGDAAAGDGLEAAVADRDVVFHLAAMTGAPWHPDFLRTNAAGVRHVAEACAARATPPRLVLVSSMAAAGPAPAGAPRVEDDPPAPVSRYGASKLAGEQAARELSARVPVTIVRPPVVFGGGDPAMLVQFRWAARGLALAPSRAAVTLVHVDDLVALIRAAARGETLAPAAPPGQGVYFGGFDAPVRWPELARRIAASVGRRRAVTVAAPTWLVSAGAVALERVARWRASDNELLSTDKARENAAGDWVCSSAKARAQLGWAPAATLDARLGETAAAYRAEGWL